MRPRRAIFGLDYIAETVTCYQRLAASVSRDQTVETDTELRWAHDVLSLYFEVTSPHKVTEPLRKLFTSATVLTSDDTPHVPYQRNLNIPSPVDYDDLLSLAQKRRSVRWFANTPVPRVEIDRAIAVAAQSPSACNRQPFVFRIFDDAQLVREVAEMPMGTAGYVEGIPVIAVVVGQFRHYPFERDRHVIYIDASLAAMSFIYALETLGISTCCINWPDIEAREKRMVSLLGLAPDERPIMCIAIGYPDPDGMVAFSQKKSQMQLRHYN